MNNPTGLEAQESLPALVAFNDGFEQGYKFPSKMLVLALFQIFDWQALKIEWMNITSTLELQKQLV